MSIYFSTGLPKEYEFELSYQRGGPEVSDHFQSVPMMDVSPISTKMRRLSTIDNAIKSLLKCLKVNKE